MKQINWKSYYAPTPKKFRKLGDTLLAISSTLAGFAVLYDDKVFAIVFLAMAVIGKFLTNFFSEDENESNTPSDPSV